MRAEFALIQAAFDLLPALTASRVVVVNAGGTALTVNAVTGTGNVAFSDSPTFTGNMVVGNINNVAISAGAGATLSIAGGKTLTACNSIAFAGTDGKTMTMPAVNANIAQTGNAQTFNGVQTFANGVTYANGNAVASMDQGIAFTPGLTLGGGNTGMSVPLHIGRLTKFGDRNFFNLRVTLNNKGSSTGNVLITGLPVAANNATGEHHPCALVASGVSSGIGTGFTAFVVAGTTTIQINKEVSGNVVTMTEADLGDTADFTISGHYRP